MADSTQPEKPSSSPTQPSKDTTAQKLGKDKAPPAAAKTSTKYDVLPPRPQLSGASSRPSSPSGHLTVPSSSTPLAQAFTQAPIAPLSSNTVILSSDGLLARARTGLAATKKATTSFAPTPSSNAMVQLFEITQLKTIKCDVCKKKNGHILYKCQGADQLQICSRCVETTDPNPAEGTIGAKSWGEYAKLKDAHAAYMQPICPGRGEDGSYQRNGVRFVVLQGKKGGKPKDRQSTKSSLKKDVTITDRILGSERDAGAHKMTEQDKSAREIARARLEGGQSKESRDKLAAARARLLGLDKADTRRERRAAVLDGGENGESVDDDTDGHGDTQAVDDEDSDATQADEDEGWDPVETAAALEESMRDMGLQRNDRSNQSEVRPKKPRWGTFSPVRTVNPRVHEREARTDLPSVGNLPQPLPTANQASTSRRSGLGSATTKASRVSSPSRPSPTSFTQNAHPRSHPHTSDMKITSRKSGSSKSASHPSTGLLRPLHTRQPEIESSSNDSFVESLHNIEGSHPHQTDPNPNTSVTEPSASRPTTYDSTQPAEQKQQRLKAQRDLQRITEEEDPYAQDKQGIDMLLHAAKIIEDRAKAQELHDQAMQLNPSAAASLAPSPERSPAGEAPRFQDPSEFSWVSSRHPAKPREPATSSSPSMGPPTLEPHGHKRRRSERLASSNLHPSSNDPPAKRARADPDPPASDPPTDKSPSKRKAKPKRTWAPDIQAYINEQKDKRKKTLEWLEAQDSSEEEGYDKGVEGGVWIESSGSEGEEGREEDEE